jgi:hypothetical protein
MADQPITQLPVATTLTGNEVTAVVQAGVTKQALVSLIANAVSPGKLIVSVSFVGSNLVFYYTDGTSASVGPIPGFVSAAVNGSGDLILTNSTGGTVNAGNVIGPQGPTGSVGPTGPAGATGATGATGAAATVAVGSTSTIAPGSPAVVTNVGSSSAAVFNFSIPRGTAGAAATISAGTTTTSNPGTNANVINSGTSSSAIFDFTIPRGAGINVGGSAGQILTKLTGADFDTGWVTVSGTGTVTSINASGGTTGLSFSGGPVTTNGTLVLGGTLIVANGGTGASTLTGYVYGNGTSAMTASTTIPTTALSGTVTNAQLAYSALTVNGNSVSLGGSTTVTATATNALTIGTGLSGTSYNGSAAVTIAIDSTVVTLTGSQILTNKTISGLTSTLSNIGNSSLTNSAVTINGNSVSLGSSTTVTASTTNALTIGTGLSGTSFNGSAAVTVAINSTVATLTGSQTLTNKSISGSTNTLTNISNGALTNSSITFGATAVSLGGTVSALNAVSIGATTRASGDFTTLSGNTVTSTTPVLSFNASNTIASFGTSTANSFNQLIIQNKAGGATGTADGNGASTNYVISNNLGTDTTYYGEFGMNSSVYTASGTFADFFSINNGVYFSSHDGDVTIGSGNGFKTYLVWGAAAASAHVINASGAIGLNTNLGVSPATTGTTNFGTSGQPMLSGGSAATPTWGTLGVSGGGTGQSSNLSQYGVVYGSTTTAMATTAAGTTGQALVATTSAAPTWGTVGVNGGGTGQSSNLVQGGIVFGSTTTAMATTAVGTAGQKLVSAGTGTPTWTGNIGSATVFTTGTAATYTIPTGCTVVKVTAIGPGGNGVGAVGSRATGGSGGGTAIKWLTGVTPGNTLTYTVGTASGTNTTVSSGTQTISTITASSGANGTTTAYAASLTTGPAGGTATGGDINIAGQAGGTSYGTSTTTISNYSGPGGAAATLSQGGPSVVVATNAGIAGTGYGAGASGSINTATVANGTTGAIIFEAF